MRENTLPAFSTRHLHAGMRLGLAVSGGADSVALLRLAQALAPTGGWSLCVLHLEHGLRGAEGSRDADFVEALAHSHDLPFRRQAADVGALARQLSTGLEDAGRQARYGWFASLLAQGELDAVATGHTLDDQAETVLAKLMRGAWLEGLAGIHPVVAAPDLAGAMPGTVPDTPHAARGIVVRPLLGTRRAALRSWLQALGQGWHEDTTNADPAFTRNRIRHTLLPTLREQAPQLDRRLAQTATLAQHDAEYWQAEVERLLPSLLLSGRPVRGGGRASSTLRGERSLAFEVERLRAYPPALRSRLLRAAAARLGAKLDFEETASLLSLCDGAGAGTPRRVQLGSTLRAERTPRELRLVRDEQQPSTTTAGPVTIPVTIPVPGTAEGFGVRITLAPSQGLPPSGAAATLRPHAPGDRVRLRHSSGAPKRIKEVLERLAIPAARRALWPVLIYENEIVWMRGSPIEPGEQARRLTITAEVLDEPAS